MDHTILCVDDEQDNVDALERLLRKDYRVLKATSGKQALGLMEGEKISLIICDQRMPEMTGVEFLTKSIETHPDTIRILLTGYTDVEAVISAINSGQIYRYVSKPWDSRDLTTAVKRAVERFELHGELREKNAALEKALSELQTLDQAKTGFMVLINHELKTPLTTLLSFLDLLKETPLDEEQGRYIDRVAKSAARLKEIIFDVLELVSAETGLTRIRPEPFVLSHALQDVVEHYKASAAERDQLISFDPGNISVVGDAKAVKSIVARLLHNAVKFADAGSEIRVSVEKNENTWISIESSGKPVHPTTIERILKPFTIDEDIMNHSKGLGLGLGIAQALLKLHGTQLTIDTDGPRFTARFPLKNP